MPIAFINRSAYLPVLSTVGSVPAGRAVRLTGALSGGYPTIAAPTGADSVVHGVIYNRAPTNTVDGIMIQVGMSNAEVKLSGTVAFDDPLYVTGTDGRWGIAPSGAVNVYYRALQAGVANDTIIAAPIGSRPSA